MIILDAYSPRPSFRGGGLVVRKTGCFRKFCEGKCGCLFLFSSPSCCRGSIQRSRCDPARGPRPFHMPSPAVLPAARLLGKRLAAEPRFGRPSGSRLSVRSTWRAATNYRVQALRLSGGLLVRHDGSTLPSATQAPTVPARRCMMHEWYGEHVALRPCLTSLDHACTR